MVNDFTFRYRLTLAERSGIGVPEPRLVLYSEGDQREVFLASSDMTTPLNSVKDVVLRSSGWPSEAEALARGAWFADRLAVALARHRVGVHPDQCVTRSGFFAPGLRMLEAQVGQRVLNDVYGLSVFATEPPPLFARPEATAVLLPSTDHLVDTFSRLCSADVTLTSRDRLALDLFNTSYLQPSSATRLLTLVMAVESLIQPASRGPESLTLVDEFLRQTHESTTVLGPERDSLLGSLVQLRLQSIGSAGRAFVSARLGNREYMQMAAPKFFTHCYGLRSRLVHGTEPQPSDQELSSASGALELFVSDIITQPFVPLRPAEYRDEADQRALPR